MWARIQTFIGDLWGQSTTQILGASALLGGLMADPQTGPFLVSSFPFMPKVVAGAAVLAMIARYTAPPPPVTTMRDEDTVKVDRDRRSVTITKAEPLPDEMVSKPAGVPAVPPQSPQD